ncbi:polysaccharide deacetylase family protein [Brevibacillus sp. AF8]|uniref:polysaccharide deacetylase family protein n=1 Tax=Brevibacillus sp. AF8 TaxID=2825881 RepID=UPI001E3AF90C|nr:polysaccharide deacetylase family protein [Brevibacillus sp. AF8]MCE0450980.1 polysaccharide deacetylase family protein [Brevibacillus sp. AF8]
MDKTGAFVISLDFELYWGVRDKRTIQSYEQNLLGVRQVIPALLELFAKYEMHVTWATVGFLFCESRKELASVVPWHLPAYADEKLSPYPYMDTDAIGEHEQVDPYHFAPSLIKLISSYPHQFIGSHTLSHYYCLEPGQTPEAFAADLDSFHRVTRKKGYSPTSIVFPRNQVQPAYLSLCKKKGFRSYRGNEQSWMYHTKGAAEETLFKRAMRLMDAYVNLSGHNNYVSLQRSSEGMVDVPSSRFLRPYHPRLQRLEKWRMKRIKRDLTHTAEHNRLYHLWWHPENFGNHMEENLSFLEEILQHYSMLRERYGMQSLSMEEAAAKWNQQEVRHEVLV